MFSSPTPPRPTTRSRGARSRRASFTCVYVRTTIPSAAARCSKNLGSSTGHSTTVHGWFDSYADANGFYLIAPDAGKNCFDASAARSGDKAAVVTMVNYLITNKGADKTRVFAAGMSSGGCMTNTLLAVYPDVFAGGSAMPGFPAQAANTNGSPVKSFHAFPRSYT